MSTTFSTIERAMGRSPVADAPRRAESPSGPARADHDAEATLHARARREEGPRVELNLARLAARGMLTPHGEHRELHEQYRRIKRPLIGNAFVGPGIGSNPANLIQVTSSVLHEGKTFTALNLSMSIAMEMDSSVVIVDADLTRRSLSALTGLTGAPGLTEVLTGEITDIADVVFATNVPKLRIVPAGAGHPRSTELIASEAMRRFTTELGARYPDRLAVFDSTPLLMDSQAASLANHMGQVVLIVEAGRTATHLVTESVSQLDPSVGRISLVLNKSTRGLGGGYYGGY